MISMISTCRGGEGKEERARERERVSESEKERLGGRRTASVTAWQQCRTGAIVDRVVRADKQCRWYTPHTQQPPTLASSQPATSLKDTLCLAFLSTVVTCALPTLKMPRPPPPPPPAGGGARMQTSIGNAALFTRVKRGTQTVRGGSSTHTRWLRAYRPGQLAASALAVAQPWSGSCATTAPAMPHMRTRPHPALHSPMPPRPPSWRRVNQT